MSEVWLGIGSNVGERRDFVRTAVEALRTEVIVEATSSLYETTPVGGPPQRSFVNAVVRITTDLEPRALLGLCRSIEEKLGREKDLVRWGPRVIDIDILMYDDLKMSEPDIEIPHPRMNERRFVLVPLLEIDPSATDPWGTKLSDYDERAEGEIRLMEPF
jgi:2-amino-4-hydroxy-6-hydroxymethyldihydropteridine diphosphokinase